MDFINTFSDKSNIDFKFVSSHSNAQLWNSLYSQCETENSKIDKKIFCVNKLKKKLRNVLYLVKVFNKMVIEDRQTISQTQSVCVNSKSIVNDCTKEDIEENDTETSFCSHCEMLAEQIEILEDQIDIRTQLISKLRNENKKISVITKKGDKSSESFLPSPQSSQADEELEEEEIKRRRLHERAAKLNLKIHDQLMKILKDVPIYDNKMDSFHNADIFESHTDKFNLTNEQKNKLFRVWLPSHMARRLEVTPRFCDDNVVIHSTESDRLRQLILFTTGESSPSVDLLDSLRPTLQDDPFAFLMKFEKAYRMVMGVKEDEEPESMIKAFVRKFKYLDPVSVQFASEKDTLEEAAIFIDQIRRSIKQNNAKIKVSVVQEKVDKKWVKSNQDSRFKSQTTPAPKKYEFTKQNGIRRNVNCYFCGKKGHLRWNCRLFLEQQGGGKENGIMASAPPILDHIQSRSPYAPLIKEIHELSMNNNMSHRRTKDDVREDRETLMPSQ
ncbi:hypothetical protein GDO81_022200 [Engystomops pustulosus]|uniref:CCHC-type domain-containing protein n=1 Tax=Engystomops pustulosus TaxID=76066 RepID=A0AAV6YY46_ENGPU|nr:hypothetical protein GDO81_022200 [Engystomops pustulosus]